jgi:hypothetical protein
LPALVFYFAPLPQAKARLPRVAMLLSLDLRQLGVDFPPLTRNRSSSCFGAL